ncbi:Hsp20/alpha crystallin family protein [Candidatus Parcubacteria bacterium]|nr:MAG: Hsp20/alpha crystallin family protein [Candidatus Parcubacteria bacterium]
MLKEKRSFFERLTGSAPEEQYSDMSYNLSENPAVVEQTFDNQREFDNGAEEEEGQLAVDISQNDNEVIVQAIVAGIRPDELDISIGRDSVAIKGRRDNLKLSGRENMICQELYWGAFGRKISLSDEIDSDNVEATIKNGMLTLRLPLARKNRVQKIRAREE